MFYFKINYDKIIDRLKLHKERLFYKMKLQRLMGFARRAIDDYNMIQEGDTVAIGISGGKDSLTLLYALSGLRRFYPNKFELVAITVNAGYKESNFSAIATLCDKLDVPYTVVETNIAEILFEERKEHNPCSLCAKLRKGAFNNKAKEIGCNKKAYAHHYDDVIETMLMSLLYEGRFHCFSPVTYLDRSDITLIRPLIYVNEQDIISFKEVYQLPVVKNPCPVDGYTKREYTKQLIKTLDKDSPGLRDRLFTAIREGNIPGWR